MPPIIRPFDSFARDIYGTINMARLVVLAEQEGAPFVAMRDYLFDRELSEEARDAHRKLAAQLSPGPKIIN